jgi:guanylate kinase
MPGKRGHIFVVSGASGTGKTSLCREILKIIPNITFSVSYTTRPPRPGEVDGIHYFFISSSRFEEMIESNELAEWTRIYGHLYGTSAGWLDLHRAQGEDMVFDIDVKGATEIKKRYPDAVTIFVLPPSMEELRRRISNRQTEDPETMELRLKKVEKEASCAKDYDYTIINDHLSEAVEQLKCIIIAERCRKKSALTRMM